MQTNAQTGDSGPLPSPLDAAGVAALLTEIGQRLEVLGEEPFKARAYYRAAESLRALTQPLGEVIAQNKLRKLPGVGEALAEKILKLHRLGTHPTLEHLRGQLPAGVLDLLRISGLGPKKAALLYQTLKITNLPELEQACRAGQLATAKGFGARLQLNILRGLEILHKNEGRALLPVAQARVDAAAELLRTQRPDLHDLVPAGELRRGCEVVSDLTLAAWTAAPSAPDAVVETIKVCLSDEAHYGLKLLYATGSPGHLRALEAHAAARGLSLSPTALRAGRKELPCKTENELYAALGLPCIPPELREDRGEIALAAAGKLPRLVSLPDVRGVLHCHTKASDGAETVSGLAEAVRARGHQYLGIADHSRSAAYAGGLSVERVEAQWREIDAVNEKLRAQSFRIFKGIESDILEDGALDYPDDLLARFDFVVASIHSRFGLDGPAQTARLLKAIAHPRTTILGHPTGRMLLRREPYEMDMEAVLKACAQHRVVVEINAHAQRLDLDWRWHQRALELGCLLSINPDAHVIAELDHMRWGVTVARKGGVPPERVLNCLDVEALAKYFASRN